MEFTIKVWKETEESRIAACEGDPLLLEIFGGPPDPKYAWVADLVSHNPCLAYNGSSPRHALYGLWNEIGRYGWDKLTKKP